LRAPALSRRRPARGAYRPRCSPWMDSVPPKILSMSGGLGTFPVEVLALCRPLGRAIFSVPWMPRRISRLRRQHKDAAGRRGPRSARLVQETHTTGLRAMCSTMPPVASEFSAPTGRSNCASMETARRCRRRRGTRRRTCARGSPPPASETSARGCCPSLRSSPEQLESSSRRTSTRRPAHNHLDRVHQNPPT
jgi:hypothetical protein